MTDIQRILRRRDFLKKGVNSWSRFKTASPLLSDRVIAADHYQNRDRSFEICEFIVTEAISDGNPDDDHMLSMLVNSAEEARLEVDTDDGRFVRENSPGSLIFETAQSCNVARGFGPFHSVVLYMNDNCLKNRVQELTDGEQHQFERLKVGSFKDDGIQVLLKMLLDLHRVQDTKRPLDFDEAADIYDRILLRLISRTEQKQPNALHKEKLNSTSIRRVIEYIDARPRGEFLRDELAGVAGVSPGHFSRMFRQTLGISPKQYIIQRRMEHSKQLLKQRSLSIAEIAEELGYTHVSHFHGEFVRHLGVTPAAYRKYA